ncbi:MAG: hypothetical protein IPM86_07265 [Saprospiraceae bacterium]|nr:hypothetical protein [Saprospiraceae bacterium]
MQVDHDNQKFHTDRNWDSTVATFIYTSVLENPVYKKRDKVNPIWKMKK